MGQIKDFLGNEIKIGDKVALVDPDSSKTYLTVGVVDAIVENGFVEIELPDKFFDENEKISESNNPYYTMTKFSTDVIVVTSLITNK